MNKALMRSFIFSTAFILAAHPQAFSQKDSTGFEIGISYIWFIAPPMSEIQEHGYQTGSGLRVSAGYKFRGKWAFTLAPNVCLTGSGMFDKREDELTQKVHRQFFMAEMRYQIWENRPFHLHAGAGSGSYISWNKPKPAGYPSFLPEIGTWNAYDIAFSAGFSFDFTRNKKVVFPIALRYYYSNPGYLRFENYTSDLPCKISMICIDVGVRYRARF